MSERGIHAYSANYTHCGLSEPLLNDNPLHQCTISALGYSPDIQGNFQSAITTWLLTPGCFKQCHSCMTMKLPPLICLTKRAIFMFCTMIMLSCNITEKFCFCNLNKFLMLLKPGTDCSLSVLTYFFLVSCPFLSLSNVPSPSLSCVALDPLNWRFMKRL